MRSEPLVVLAKDERPPRVFGERRSNGFGDLVAIARQCASDTLARRWLRRTHFAHMMSHTGRPRLRQEAHPAHAHAVEMAHEGVPLVIIQRQLGHANLGITSIYLQGIDSSEIIDIVHSRPAPVISASAGLIGS
jgi:site-specific recombinase XerD